MNLMGIGNERDIVSVESGWVPIHDPGEVFGLLVQERIPARLSFFVAASLALGSCQGWERNARAAGLTEPRVLESTPAPRTPGIWLGPTPTLDLPVHPATRVFDIMAEINLYGRCPPPEKIGPQLDGRFADPQVEGRTCPGE